MPPAPPGSPAGPGRARQPGRRRQSAPPQLGLGHAAFQPLQGDLPWGSRRAGAGQEDYAGHVERAVELVADYTGIELPPARAQVYVFDRAEWVDANLAQFELMFAP